MIDKIKAAFRFFNEQRAHSLNHIPPLNALIKKEMPPWNIFFFTMDDIWEKTSISDLKRLTCLLNKHKIKGTFFITPYYDYNDLSAKKANQLKETFKNHEIAMHGIRHNKDLIGLNPKERIYELSHCKKFLENRLNRKIYGYRSPKFLRNRHLLEELSSSGFLYNSDQFLFRPYPFVKDKIAVIPCHDKCDPFALNVDKSEILELIARKLVYSEISGKPYVFLMHAYDINEKNLAILDKILSEVKSHEFIQSLSLSDFSKSLFKKNL